MTTNLPTTLRTGRSRRTGAVVFVDNSNADDNDVIRADCTTISDDGTDEAFAAEIVRRWNAHAELVEALRGLNAIISMTAFKYEAQRAVLQQSVDCARAAIARATGDSEREDNASMVSAGFLDLLAALREIAKGEGPYHRDPYTRACNTIDAMKAIARAAIARATEPTT